MLKILQCVLVACMWVVVLYLGAKGVLWVGQFIAGKVILAFAVGLFVFYVTAVASFRGW